MSMKLKKIPRKLQTSTVNYHQKIIAKIPLSSRMPVMGAKPGIFLRLVCIEKLS